MFPLNAVAELNILVVIVTFDISQLFKSLLNTVHPLNINCRLVALKIGAAVKPPVKLAQP